MSQYVNGKRAVAFERVSEAKVLSDLREAAERLGEPFSIQRYRKQAPSRGWVADFTAANRFGSWAAACRAAGIKSNPRPRARSSRFDERDCVCALRACAEELGRSPTLVGYASWAAGHPDRPKAPTIRYQLGGWNAALRAAGLALNKPYGGTR